jgi:hypothetical protein
MSTKTELKTERGRTLDCAVAAAEAAVQATYGIWQQMTEGERAWWLASCEDHWRRLDIYLHRLLPVAEQVIADEGAADERS